MIGAELRSLLKDAVAALGGSPERVVLEHPKNRAHGDYSTNAALSVGKELKKNPRDVAEAIVRYIEQRKPSEVERLEIAGSGFINFHLSQNFFIDSLKEILVMGERWGRVPILKGKKVIVEYTDPNPFKEFHIGHLMDNAIGESLSRVLEYAGGEIRRVNYQGDVGLHVAKAVWGMKRSGLSEFSPKDLGECYAQGARAYEEEGGQSRTEIEALNRAIYEGKDDAVTTLYQRGRDISLAYFETIYQRLGTKFDHYFFESETGTRGAELVRAHIADGVFEESEGAVVFRGEKEGLHTRVFLNSEGLPTYEAKELGLAKLKYEYFPYDIAVVVTANEIAEYFKVLLAAMRKISPELASKTIHIPHGMLRLPSGKMSSRTGDVISATKFLDEIKESTFRKLRFAPEISDRDALADAIAVGAIKYSILKQGIGKDIIFDMERSLSLEGDSGPYLQYAHTRAVSIRAKAKAEGVMPDTGVSGGEPDELERLLYRFPEVVERAASEYEPHHIVSYLTDVSSSFNSYYARERIVSADLDSPYKVALTDAVRLTLRNGLWLLGIKAPERM